MSISDQEIYLQDALSAFDFGGEVTSVERYGHGHINDTFLVQAQGPHGTLRFVLQRINSHVFKDVTGLMQNVISITEYLRGIIRRQGGDERREALTVVRPTNGEDYHTTPDGEAWRVYLFIEGAVCYQIAETPELFRASAVAFGQFARMLCAYPAHTLHETIPFFHDTRVRLQQFEQAVAKDVCGRAEGCRSEIEAVLARRQDCGVLMDRLDAGELPLRVTHNDTKLNNIMMDPRTRQGVCVIDLDTVMPGLLLHDYGDSIRYGANNATEDQKDTSQVSFSLPLFETYTAGYLQAAGAVMTDLEMDLMPWGARLMTLECGMRFLADHLQGDAYFRARHEGHNLDRARIQLRLLSEMEQQWQQMNEIVQAQKRMAENR